MHIDHVTYGYISLDKLKEISNKKHNTVEKEYLSDTKDVSQVHGKVNVGKKMTEMEKNRSKI